MSWWLCTARTTAPEHATWLGARELAVLAALSKPRRRADWLLGRWVAKHALRAAGVEAELAQLEILADDDGAPVAWLGERCVERALSLSHRAGAAVALAAAPELRVGCDLERIEPRSAAFVRDYFTERERAAADAAPNAALVANAIWSAKESALKALRLGLSRDTRSVEVSLSSAADDGRWHALAVDDVEGGARFEGHLRTFDGFVVTLVADAALSPPQQIAA
ncbi:MAG: 4'-phosphopantetheinyl transferase superfamily protein [Myxococcales bacterium]|nr:4'-phosphopantetheinyl transferase superfamily protein [Myxococcales bacterium]